MGTKTTTQITKTELPAWYNQYAQNVLGKAYQATSEPYQAYGAPRIAGFAPEQEQAFGLAKGSIGQWRPYIGAAGEQIGRGTGSFTAPGMAQSYMSPYIQNVVQGIGSTAARNLYENIIPQINRTFVGGGTFGGSRNTEFMNRAVRDTQSAALSEQAKQMQEGYKAAQEQYNAEAGRALTAAPLYSALGEQYQGMMGADVNALSAIGAQRQGLGQKSADLAYQDFLAQRNYPYEQVQRLAGIGATVNPQGAGTQTATTSAPGPSSTAQTLGTVAGLAGTAAKIFGLKDGGDVEKKRRVKKPAKKASKKQGLGWLKEAA